MDLLWTKFIVRQQIVKVAGVSIGLLLNVNISFVVSKNCDINSQTLLVEYCNFDLSCLRVLDDLAVYFTYLFEMCLVLELARRCMKLLMLKMSLLLSRCHEPPTKQTCALLIGALIREVMLDSLDEGPVFRALY